MEQALQLPRLHLDTFATHHPKFLDPIAPPTVPFPPPTWYVFSSMYTRIHDRLLLLPSINLLDGSYLLMNSLFVCAYKIRCLHERPRSIALLDVYKDHLLIETVSYTTRYYFARFIVGIKELTTTMCGLCLLDGCVVVDVVVVMLPSVAYCGPKSLFPHRTERCRL